MSLTRRDWLAIGMATTGATVVAVGIWLAAGAWAANEAATASRPAFRKRELDTIAVETDAWQTARALRSKPADDDSVSRPEQSAPEWSDGNTDNGS